MHSYKIDRAHPFETISPHEWFPYRGTNWIEKAGASLRECLDGERDSRQSASQRRLTTTVDPSNGFYVEFQGQPARVERFAQAAEDYIRDPSTWPLQLADRYKLGSAAGAALQIIDGKGGAASGWALALGYTDPEAGEVIAWQGIDRPHIHRERWRAQREFLEFLVDRAYGHYVSINVVGEEVVTYDSSDAWLAAAPGTFIAHVHEDGRITERPGPENRRPQPKRVETTTTSWERFLDAMRGELQLAPFRVKKGRGGRRRRRPQLNA